MKVAAKMRQQACTTGKSRLETAVDQKLADARIDEDHLDQHHAGDQVGEVQRHDIDDRRPGVRQGVLDDHLPGRRALEPRHLDIGRGQQVDDRGPRHAHHVRGDHQHQRQRRQEGAVQQFSRRLMSPRGWRSPGTS